MFYADHLFLVFHFSEPYRRKSRYDDEEEQRPRGGGRRDRPMNDSNDPFAKAREDEGKYQWGKPEQHAADRAAQEAAANAVKLQPDFKPSGALEKAARTNDRGVEVKYVEPAEARKPSTKWRLYPFKGEEALEPYMIYRQSSYLFGRDRQVADIPTDHPSCSKQHAAIQFREVEIEDKSTGMTKRVVKPYLMDLGSTNGTFLNNVKIDSERYVELLPKDAIRFGFSTREFIVIHENVSVNAPDR